LLRKGEALAPDGASRKRSHQNHGTAQADGGFASSDALAAAARVTVNPTHPSARDVAQVTDDLLMRLRALFAKPNRALDALLGEPTGYSNWTKPWRRPATSG